MFNPGKYLRRGVDDPHELADLSGSDQPNLWRRHPMATRLDKTLKRELEVEGKLYTVTISPEGVKIVPKGARKGPEITWQTLLSGEAELRRDLNASVDAYSG
jgi:hypothetical protein